MNTNMMAALLSLWLAVAALSVLVFREIGWDRLKKHALTLAVLAFSLMALPGAAIVKKALPYKDRILARVIAHHSQTVDVQGACPVFPPNNVWNVSVRDLPVDANSSAYIESMGPSLPLHADFGVDGGIPYVVTDGIVATTQVDLEGGESDRGPYHIPDNAPNEGGEDSHVLVLDRKECKLYELFAAHRIGTQHWQAGSGAIFNLQANELRTLGWTSADAAGLPMFPGLVRYDEVKAGAIRHALRFTTRKTRRGFVWPARHMASYNTDVNLPPMGTRFRLKSSFEMGSLSPEAQVILTALKEYGMFLSDNGGPWFLSGAPDSSWSARTVADLKTVMGSDFEAVNTAPIMVDSNSAEARRQ